MKIFTLLWILIMLGTSRSILGVIFPLLWKYKISCDGESPKRKMFYQGDFLVSSNIRHECLLGWDFIANNGLTLRAAEDNGRHSYFVQGRHGISPISRNRQVSDHTCQG